MKLFFLSFIKVTSGLTLIVFLQSCNTVVGTVKGVAKDSKAFYIYSRDALTQRDISDSSD